MAFCDLGKEIAGRDVPLGLSLEDARGRALQIEVLQAGGFDQGIKRGIVEGGPPSHLP